VARDPVPEAEQGGPSRRHRRRSANRRDVVAIVLSVALGIALLGLSVPRTIAAWYALAAQPVLEKLLIAKEPPSDAEFAHAIAGLDNANAWVPSARRLTDLAILEIGQLLRLPRSDPKRAILLASAEQHLVDGLVANPTDGYAWLNLAIVREQAGLPPRQIAVALVQSLAMAPNARPLWLPRASMLLVYWPSLQSDELLVMRAQLHTIWTVDKNLQLPLLQVAARLGRVQTISWGIGDDPPEQAELKKLRDTLAKLAPR